MFLFVFLLFVRLLLEDLQLFREDSALVINTSMVLNIQFHPPGPVSCTRYQPHLPSKKNTSQGGPDHRSIRVTPSSSGDCHRHTSPNMSSSLFHSSSGKDFTQPPSLACENPSYVLRPSEDIWTGLCLFLAICRHSPPPALFLETRPASPLRDEDYPRIAPPSFPSHGPPFLCSCPPCLPLTQ